MKGPSLQLAEPPARYLVQRPVVVDCSVVAGLVFGEAWQEQAQALTDGRPLRAPHLLACEITNVALKKHRRGEAHALEGLGTAASMDIALYPVEPVEVAGLASRYQLSAYDAAYLWLAARLGNPLATFDDKLAAAAKAHLASLG